LPPGVVALSRRTTDGKTLLGYMAKAKSAAGPAVEPRGYLLVLPGNGVIAQQLISLIEDIAALGYDVYVYDYRGYGRSDGPSTVLGIVADTKELIAKLGNPAANGGRGYATHIVYGISAGAAIAFNALDATSNVDRLIIDGVPATMSVNIRVRWNWLRFPYLSCPAEFGPLNRNLFIARRTLLIKGDQDVILKNTQHDDDQERLLTKMKAAGVCVSVQPAFNHPLMDGYTGRRIEMIGDFLKADLAKGCPALPVFR